MKVALLISVTVAALLGVTAGKKVVCYYTNWSYYRQGLGKFLPSNIDPSLCTHIMYAFSVVEDNKIKIYDQNVDVNREHIKLVGDVRKINPSVKVMLAVGGWNAGSIPFSNMAKSASTRRIFIDSIVEFMERYNYDGVDVDWEYPANRGGIPEDKQNFNTLIMEIQERFRQIARRTGKPKMLVTAAVGPAPHTASIAYDIPTVCRELDFVNLMTYDIHGTWDSITGYSSPLYAGPKEVDPQNMPDAMTRDWINAGCDREKLIFGIPFYGRGWRLKRGEVPGVGAKGVAANGDSYTRAEGIKSYYELCRRLNTTGWSQSYDDVAVQAIAFGYREWYTFDNERSVTTKVNYINSMNLGGAMIWALDFDDFNGYFCGRGRYPLLSIVNRGMRGGSTTPRRRPVRRRPTTRRRPATTRPTTQRSTTTTARPTTRPTRRLASGCQPPCRGTGLTFLEDRCDSRGFYMCNGSRVYRMSCAPGTVFRKSCSCCQAE